MLSRATVAGAIASAKRRNDSCGPRPPSVIVSPSAGGQRSAAAVAAERGTARQPGGHEAGDQVGHDAGVVVESVHRRSVRGGSLR